MTQRSMKVTNPPSSPQSPVLLNGTPILGGLKKVTVTHNPAAMIVSGTYNPPDSASVTVPTPVWNALVTRCASPPFTLTITHNASNQVTAISFQQASARAAADAADEAPSERL
jgi:uncharacterized protein involved in exopolysaccharide biosynthesis